MNFALLELDIKSTKNRPYVRLFTEKRIKYFQETAKNDAPLIPTKSDGTLVNTDLQSSFAEFLSNYKKMLDKYFPLVKVSRQKSKTSHGLQMA